MFEQISKTHRFGYLRVSSQTQEYNSSLEIQKQEFIQKGVTFISLDLLYFDDMSVNQLISTNLATIATFKNEDRKERQSQEI